MFQIPIAPLLIQLIPSSPCLIYTRLYIRLTAWELLLHQRVVGIFYLLVWADFTSIELPLTFGISAGLYLSHPRFDVLLATPPLLFFLQARQALTYWWLQDCRSSFPGSRKWGRCFRRKIRISLSRQLSLT